jgi:DNA repair photolyase
MERPGRRRQRGRGALDNPSSRFEAQHCVEADDGWGTIEVEAPDLATVVQAEVTRTILSTNSSPDLPFSQSINPYKGCEHGCVYCFARPTHAYLGLSPGLDFETRIFSKPNAARLLKKELSKANYKPKLIVLGANTDPYQPIERSLRISRGLLSVLRDFGHPVSIITKSSSITRDIDLLSDLSERSLVSVYLSITTLDPQLASRMEPRAAAPARRLQTLRALSDAGIPVGVLASPMIPALNDRELEGILTAARAHGASSAGYILLRLPREVAELFTTWLRHHYPGRADKVLSLLRDSRDGELYRSEFGTRMKGTGPYAEALEQRFRIASRRLGLDAPGSELSLDHFKVPSCSGKQLQLFAGNS